MTLLDSARRMERWKNTHKAAVVYTAHFTFQRSPVASRRCAYGWTKLAEEIISSWLAEKEVLTPVPGEVFESQERFSIILVWMEHNQEVLILSSCTFNMVAIKSSADT